MKASGRMLSNEPAVLYFFRDFFVCDEMVCLLPLHNESMRLDLVDHALDPRNEVIIWTCIPVPLVTFSLSGRIGSRTPKAIGFS